MKKIGFKDLHEDVTKNKEFTLENLPYPVRVKFVFNYPSGTKCVGMPVISHFEFHTNPAFRSLTDTGYKSHFFSPYLLIDYMTIEEAARELVLAIVKENSNSEADNIENGDFQLSLF